MSKTVQFRSGNRVPYSQDFNFRVGVPSGVMFSVEEGARFQKEGDWRLTADGYGVLGKPNSYGNGALYVRSRDVSAEDLVFLAKGEQDERTEQAQDRADA